ncbi:MAG: FMN-binding protein [Lentisphaerae bacterium]|jgi:Na+-transporting NADH:ubiquinone oxidoreductase subunit C|nr:FMN-binding protein [Lentisphaerota bacterium]
MKNSPIYTIIYVFATCAISACLLTFPQVIWSERMKTNEEFGRIKAMMDATGLLDPSDKQEIVTEKFAKLIQPKTMGDLSLFEARNEKGELAAFLFEIEGHGHEGLFKGILAFTPDRQRIKALRVYDHQETPGLGGMISDKTWVSQFNDLPMVVDGVPGIIIDSAVKAPNAVQAITGASSTVRSLSQAINTQIHSFLAGGIKLIPLDLGLGPDAVTRATPGYPKGFKPPPNLRTLDKRDDFMVPEGLVNLALNKPVTSCLGDEEPLSGKLSQITDGNKKSNEQDYVEMMPEELSWVQVDLGEVKEIFCVVIWHYYKNAVVYKDVIVQIADDPEMKENCRIVFNNDYDNSAGFGKGDDPTYFAGWWGELVDTHNPEGQHEGQKARYIRVFTSGGEAGEDTRFVEIAAFGKK